MTLRRPLDEMRADPRWRGGSLVATPHGTVHAVVHGEGPDVVLIHGVTDSVLTWHDIRTKLTGVRVHAVDLPGHGLSDVPAAPPTLEVMAQWVSAYLDAAGVERAVVVGWSLGGGVAVELAAADGGRVRALVLVGPAAVPLKLAPTLSLLTLPLTGELMPWIGSRSGPRRMAMRDTYGRRFRPSDAVLDRYYLGWEVAERARFIRSLLRTLSFDATLERLPRIQVPARILHGAEDRLVPMRAGRELTDRLPNAELDLLDGVGHSPHVERPEVVLAAIHAALG